MKKSLSKVIAIIVTIALMASSSVVMTVMAEDVATDISVFLPESYGAQPTDSVFDVANELVTHSRIVESYNWKGWTGAETSPMINDKYGLQRKEENASEYAYVTLEVKSANEYFAVGMVIANQYVGTCDNFYYVSADGTNWKPIQPVGYAEPALNNETTAYTGEVDLIGNLPEDTKYVRIATYNPLANSWWAPLFDFVDIYDIDTADADRFAAATLGYKVATSIESYAQFTASELALGTPEGLKAKVDATTSYRTTDSNIIVCTNNAKGNLAFKVNDTQVIETATVFDEGASNKDYMSIEFFYTTDADAAEVEWKALPVTSIAKTPTLTVKSDGTTAFTGNYRGYVYRLFNLPEGTEGVQIVIGSKSWAPTIDYIDILDVDTAYAPRFEAVMDGYSAKATTVIESYGQFTASPLAIGTPVGLQDAGDANRNYRTTDTKFITPSANAKGNLAFMVDDTQVIETATVFDEGTSNKAYMSIEFFYTTDVNAAELVWTALPETSIAKTNTLNVKSDGTTAFTGNYRGYVYRLFNLPEGTEGIQIVLGSKSWAPTIDYIDIYDVNTDLTDANRFANAIADCTVATTIESLAEFNANEIKLGEVSGLQSASDSNRNYRTTNTMFITPSANAKGNLAFKVNDSQVIETTTVFDEANNLQYMSIEFFYTTDADAATIVWQPVPVASIAKTETLTVKSDGTTAFTGNYRAYTYRLFNLPEGTEGIKIILGSRTWAPTIDYIDIYDVNTFAQGRYEAAFDGLYTVQNKAYFEDNTKINAEGYVVSYEGLTVHASGLGISEANYAKADTNTGGNVVVNVTNEQVVRTGLVVHKSYKKDTYLTYYVSDDNVNWTKLTDKHIASTEEIRTTVATTPNATDYYLVEEKLTNLPKGTEYLKVELTTPTAWQPGLDFIYVYDVVETLHAHTYGEWLYNPIKHTVEKFCNDDYTYYIKGNVIDSQEAEDLLDICDIVMMAQIADGAEFNGEADALDCDETGIFDFDDITWLRKFILRKIYG